MEPNVFANVNQLGHEIGWQASLNELLQMNRDQDAIMSRSISWPLPPSDPVMELPCQLPAQATSESPYPALPIPYTAEVDPSMISDGTSRPASATLYHVDADELRRRAKDNHFGAQDTERKVSVTPDHAVGLQHEAIPGTNNANFSVDPTEQHMWSTRFPSFCGNGTADISRFQTAAEGISRRPGAVCTRATKSCSFIGAPKEMLYRAAAMQPINYVSEELIRRPRRKNVRISNDPQSVAARNRRQKISDKIRTLQRLVPGGLKMDTASMLEEAVQYIKFLKMEVETMEAIDKTLQPLNAVMDPSKHHHHHQPLIITPPDSNHASVSSVAPHLDQKFSVCSEDDQILDVFSKFCKQVSPF